MAEVHITKSGQRLIFDRVIANEAQGLAAFLQEMRAVSSDVGELEALLSGYPAFQVSFEGQTLALIYSRAHRADVIEIAGLLVRPEFADEGLAEKLLELFEEKACSWKNAIFFSSRDEEIITLLEKSAYGKVFSTEETHLWHKALEQR